MNTIKPLVGTVQFSDVSDIMDKRHLVEWEGQGLRDQLLQLPSLLDHTHFKNTDLLMSMCSVKSKTFYYHVLRAHSIRRPPM
jgi:hypothetical protein